MLITKNVIFDGTEGVGNLQVHTSKEGNLKIQTLFKDLLRLSYNFQVLKVYKNTDWHIKI